MRREYWAETEASPDGLFAVVGELTTYSEWLDVVDAVEPDTDGNGSAWIVTLRARIGPLSRSKRLRMVSVPQGAPYHARFERCELDGKNHSTWVFEVAVDPLDRPPLASRAKLELTYDGSLWSGMLDGVLDAAAEKATDNLRRYIAEQA